MHLYFIHIMLCFYYLCNQIIPELLFVIILDILVCNVESFGPNSPQSTVSQNDT